MFSDPAKNIEQFAPRLGSFVADLGAGSGHYSFALSRAIGDKGKVYAVDIQKDLLARLKNEANRQGLYNVEVIWGDVEKTGGSQMKESFLDSVVVSNLLFQIEDKNAVAKEARRILKSGGVLLVVDWSDSFGGIGPLPEKVVAKESAKSIFEQEGFSFEREINSGAHHYGLVFRKP